MTYTPAWFQPSYMVTFTTDKSKGFGDKRFPLYVNGADLTVEASQAFLESYDRIVRGHIATQDQHFWAEYALSNEAKTFPPHQIYGTEECDYLIDFSRMKAPVYWIFKNVFDIGGARGDSGVSPEAVLKQMTDPVEWNIFLNLFKVATGDIRKPGSLEFGATRDDFFKALVNSGVRTSLHLGDATDYCVRDALKYALTVPKFDNVVLLTDLSSGIYNKAIPGGVGSLDELLDTDPVLNACYKSGQLVLTTSAEALGYLKQAA